MLSPCTPPRKRHLWDWENASYHDFVTLVQCSVCKKGHCLGAGTGDTPWDHDCQANQCAEIKWGA